MFWFFLTGSLLIDVSVPGNADSLDCSLLPRFLQRQLGSFVFGVADDVQKKANSERIKCNKLRYVLTGFCAFSIPTCSKKLKEKSPKNSL